MEQPTHDQVTPGSSLEVAGPQSIVDGLAQLVRLPLAVVLLPWPEHAPVRAVANYWTSPDSGPETLKTLEDLLLEQLNAEGPLGFLQDERLPGLTTWAEPVRLDPGRAAGALGVTRDNTEQWSEAEISTIRVLAATCGALWARASAEHQQGLDELVAQVAERLMIATLSNLQEILDWTIETFARFIDADVALYRRNDHAAGLSILVAEYPKRPEIPDPDPLAAVPFEADPIFMALRDLKEPLIIRKSSSPEDYNTRVEEGSGIGNFSGAAVPLLNGDETEACLGFLHFRDVEWTTPEINALQTLATMLRQLNARIDAESRLQHIALHDDLTGLPNRRAMLEELDRRLTGTNGQTALLFMDLDRFKFMNDYLGHG